MHGTTTPHAMASNPSTDGPVQTGGTEDRAMTTPPSESAAKGWLRRTIDQLPTFRLCMLTGVRSLDDTCPEHGGTDCIRRYVQIESVLTHAS
jgi:hypothetical protein